ncbi:MAG: hypothetical protein AAFU57_02210 [Bacteroidota bacterium]
MRYVLFGLLCFSLHGCWFHDDTADDVEVEPDFSFYEPVLLTRTEFETSVKLKSPEPIIKSGKIYIKDRFLFVNELRKGFHIFDNSNPANPVKISFISAPGSTDLAIRENVFYINQATDLIAVEFQAANNMLKVSKRIRNAFPEILDPNGFFANNVPEESVVVDWKLKNESE